jgi:hypothetical protein
MTNPPRLPKSVYALIDRAVRVQQPTVAGYVARLRRRHPDAEPADVVAMLERQYLVAVTGTGAAIGGTATAPGIGTVSALVIGAGETVTFLETTAVFVLAVAEVHGVHMEDVERRRALLLAVLLGESGSVIMEKATGRATQHWAKVLPDRVPRTAVEAANRQLARWLVRRYGARQGAVVLGRLVPFGLGAAIGGAANAAIGKTIISSVRRAFGAAPEHFAGPPPAAVRTVHGEVVEQ